MPITSVDIDADLLRQVKDLYGVRTTKDAIALALRDAVMRQRQLAAVEGIAALELDEHAETVEYDQ